MISLLCGFLFPFKMHLMTTIVNLCRNHENQPLNLDGLNLKLELSPKRIIDLLTSG